jgi:cardiolipin synthase
MYLLAIARAQRYIHVTNPYFVPDKRMRQSLLEAAHRGVKVVVLLPGAIDNNIVRQASRRELGQLLQAGVEVHEYLPALLHAKIMIVDGVWATLGSTNLDNRSFALNDELNVALYSRELAGQLEQAFTDDLARSRRVTYEAWKHRGLTTRLLELFSVPLRDQL